MSGFKSEKVSGLILEKVSGFVGNRSDKIVSLSPSGSVLTTKLPFHKSWRLRKARIHRRARRLAAFAGAILTATPEAHTLAPTGWLFLAGWLALAAPPSAVPAFVATSGALFLLLGVAALIDGLYFVLPDGPLLALTGLALLIRVNDPPAIAAFVGAGLAAYAIFWLLARGYEKISGRPGLGEGDARLFALAGLWLGFEGLPSCLLIAALSGLTSAALTWRGSVIALSDPLPFGPHLALGLWLTWMFGPLEPSFP